jgi:DinB superfamily
MNDPLAELTTNPRVPLAEPLPRARASMLAAVGDLLAVPDAALERPWRWRPGDEIDADVRYGCYRIHELLEEAITSIARGGAAQPEPGRPEPAVPPLAAATTARWELRGALAPLPAPAWDADPGGGEWSIRQTVSHVIASQRSYGWTTAWFLSRAGLADAGEYAPDGALPPDPDEEHEADGEIRDVLARLDGLVDQAAECLASLDAAALAVPGRWSGLPVTVDFRLGRLASHIREHTIQVDKTVALLGQPTSEVGRLARLVLSTYGRLEALVFGRPMAAAAPGAVVVARAAAEAAATATAVRSAAESGAPPSGFSKA